ncbi:MAG: glutamate-5-semialdehyde dehydrogenase [Lysobacteraceae bacterium]
MTSGIRELAIQARAAQRQVAALDAIGRRRLIEDMANALQAGSEAVLAANAEDMARAEQAGTRGAMLDRLRLDADRIAGIVAALLEIAAQDDPVGQVTRRQVLPNGLLVERERLPLGLIAMIYEARPNVTADAAALCIKAGNAVLLRGGSEARSSNAAIAACLHAALRANALPEAAVSVITDPAREHVLELLRLSDLVDLAIPRGGEGLIRFVAENARVPVIKHYKGVCHLYVDKAADAGKALDLLVDGKTSRPGVCNALETLLIHVERADDLLPVLVETLSAQGVTIYGCERSRARLETIDSINDEGYDREYLDLAVSLKLVDGLEDALAHIARHGSDHTEVIVTEDGDAADAFIRGVRSSAVMVNASSRFNDGGQLGLGAEIGISTTRLHAYGPMGAESLTIERFVVRGDGQVRHPESRQKR